MSDQKNPWKTISSREIYKNPWIRLREDQVVRPDGTHGIYGVVETRIATGVLALSSTQEVYLVGQYRYTLEQYSWEIIEGGQDEGEVPLETAKRELKEEAGLSAAKWTELGGEVHLSNCYTSEVARFFLAEDLEEGSCKPDATEVLEVRSVPFLEALQMVQEGEITDAMSIIGIYRLKEYLGA